MNSEQTKKIFTDQSEKDSAIKRNNAPSEFPAPANRQFKMVKSSLSTNDRQRSTVDIYGDEL